MSLIYFYVDTHVSRDNTVIISVMTNGKYRHLYYSLPQINRERRRFIVLDRVRHRALIITYTCTRIYASHYVRRPGNGLMPRVFRDQMPFVINPDDDIGRSLTRPRKIDPSLAMTHRSHDWILRASSNRRLFATATCNSLLFALFNIPR